MGEELREKASNNKGEIESQKRKVYIERNERQTGITMSGENQLALETPRGNVIKKPDNKTSPVETTEEVAGIQVVGELMAL